MHTSVADLDAAPGAPPSTYLSAPPGTVVFPEIALEGKQVIAR